MKSFNVVVTVSTTICVDANTPEDAIKKVQKALDANDAGIAGDEQIAQWDTRYDTEGKKVLDDAE